jgi:hypothetical protein
MDTSSQRLLLSKYLYTRGADILRGGGPFDAGLAVSLFQDAVELAVFSCAAKFSASVKDKAAFPEIWEAANSGATSAGKPPLQMKLDMDALNKARVNFKHYGQRPDPKDAETHRINCGQFLSRLAKDYFELEFSSLSLVSLVQDDQERHVLENALKRQKLDDKRGALERCSEALDLMARRRQAHYGHGILVAYPSIDPVAKEYVDQQIAHLRNQIRDVEDVFFAGICGVPTMDFILVRDILPTKLGNEFRFERWPPDGLPNETAARCIELMAQYSIGLSEQLRAPSRIVPGAEYVA